MHIPVLQKEVIEYLNPKPQEKFIDATFGFGGHSILILEKILPDGRLLGIDRSPEMITKIESDSRFLKFKKNLILICDNFVNLKEIVEKNNFKEVSGILFDLGMSRWHIEESQRGFSLKKEEILDMRYNPQDSLTAEEIINRWPKEKIENILREYGQERFAKKISEKILENRKRQSIKTTFQLIDIIKKAIPVNYQHQKIHFATRTFQALRIAVNDELNNIDKALPQAWAILKKEGRLAIISFHSLEDRMVKNFFKDYSRKGFLKILTKKPIRPESSEIIANPSSRSAKLRVAIKII